MSSSLAVLILQCLEAVLLVVCAVWLTLYVTYRYFQRLRTGDRCLKSFAVWVRDLMDVAFGLG